MVRRAEFVLLVFAPVSMVPNAEGLVATNVRAAFALGNVTTNVTAAFALGNATRRSSATVAKSAANIDVPSAAADAVLGAAGFRAPDATAAELVHSPPESEESVAAKIQTWCQKAVGDSSKYQKFSRQKADEAQALAVSLKDKQKALQLEKAAELRKRKGDPVAQMEFERSEAGRKLSHGAMAANQGYLAARAALQQWSSCSNSLGRILDTNSRVCVEERKVHEEFQAKRKSKNATLVRIRNSVSVRALDRQPWKTDAKTKVLDALKKRKRTLERRLLWCNAQRAAVADSQKARDAMITRTNLEKEMHQKAIEKIERKAEEFSGMCQDAAADGKAFADIALGEKKEYAALSENAGSWASAWDDAHRAMVGWRTSVDDAYAELRKKCTSIQEAMRMRTISRDEQLERLEDGSDQYGREDPPEVCPDEAQTKADLEEVKGQIKEFEDHPFWSS